MTSEIYKVSTGEYVKSIHPLVLTDKDNATPFEDAEIIAEGLEQSEGTSFKIGRPGDRQ